VVVTGNGDHGDHGEGMPDAQAGVSSAAQRGLDASMARSVTAAASKATAL
jgi:hypothetical protein